MEKEQLKLRIDDLIKRCDILEDGDIYTDPKEYYNWIIVKVNAKIAYWNKVHNLDINFLVIVIAVSSLMTSLMALTVTISNNLNTNSNISAMLFTTAVVFLAILVLWAIRKSNSNKVKKVHKNLYILRELLNQYIK